MIVYNYSETHWRASLHSFFKALELEKGKEKKLHKNAAIDDPAFCVFVKGDSSRSDKLALFLSACDTASWRQSVCVSFYLAWRKLLEVKEKNNDTNNSALSKAVHTDF